MIRSKKPIQYIKIAKERIQILFGLAEREFRKHPERSKRYIELARKIGLRYNIRLPKELKRKFCKNCNTLLVPGLSSRTRIKSDKKTVEIRCLNCNKVYRYSYK